MKQKRNSDVDENASAASLDKLCLDIKRLLPQTVNKRTENPNLPAPYGYNFQPASVAESEQQSTDASLIVKRSWEMATAPFKALPQMLLMMWMSGNQLSIWSIMMVGYMVFRPIKSVFNIGVMFEKIQGAQAPIQRLVYLLGETVALCLALYKIQMMGLLPLNPSDWAANEEPPEWLEHGYGPTSFA